MKTLLEKLNYKGQERIAIINSKGLFRFEKTTGLKDVRIDNEIDQRYPYEFILIFAKGSADVEATAQVALHNLAADGTLWYCYPKKTSKKFKSDIDRDHGWDILNNAGFFGIRMVAVDTDWSALRFRNIRYIKSSSGRFPGKP